MVDVIAARGFESKFFGRKIGLVDLTSLGSVPDGLGPDLAHELLAGGWEIVEARVPFTLLQAIPVFEEVGFRSVDSRIAFATRVATSEFELAENPAIRDFQQADLPSVLGLTHANLTDNPKFVSRYKMEDVFGEGAARRWFEAWISQMVGSADSHCAVAEVDSEVVGFFVFGDGGTREGEPVLKGILTAVDPAHRGHRFHLAMQSYLLRRCGHEFVWIDNTTQLSNYPVINNHIRSDRRLDQCSLTLLWVRSGDEKCPNDQQFDR